MAELVLRLRKALSERGLDARADTLGWHLRHQHGVRLSRATIHRIPTQVGAVIPEPAVNGRLHHLGIGRTHARTHVLILVHDLDIRVVDAATGELLRELVLDPTKDYQATGRPPGPVPKHPK